MSSFRTIGALLSGNTDNKVGGTEPGTANTISGCRGIGVLISGSGATGIHALSNSIFYNGGLGIDLVGGIEDANEVTANDTDDPDTGSKDLQNSPVITSAIRNPTTGATTITGTLNSNPSQDFAIQCFLTGELDVTGEVDASGHAEGSVLLDTATASDNDGDGDVTFACDTQVPLAGQAVTATATNVSSGNSSEYSENEAVVQP